MGGRVCESALLGVSRESQPLTARMHCSLTHLPPWAPPLDLSGVVVLIDRPPPAGVASMASITTR